MIAKYRAETIDIEDVLFADDDDKNKLGVLKHYVSMICLYVKNI